ncbi:glycosyltransferase [Amaricoccus solimangrovi]|uniref:Glycosyltransferase family 4 protein n=1 Tax=Amaricoccus solimangrovi TaxID=2589815 RepID=A0A501WPB7_9RHOB|nr:glycosyltransferase [Amaricoccus solimangrovi]TPE49137.1 glycosyltransferase family 4 protein [Amaricoccus solimangrovi]
MRIVHILTRLLRAGSEENTLLTCAGQIADGHEVILVHGHEYLPGFAEQTAPGIRTLEVKALTRELNPVADLTAYGEILRLLRRLRPDIVHTHQSKAGIVGRFAAAGAGVPVVVHGVHILPFLGETGAKRMVYLYSELAAAKVTHAFIHVSDGMRNACLTHGVGRDAPHHIVRSGFSLRRFAEAAPPEDWRRILRLAPGERRPPVIAMLSALEPRKRHLELLDHARALLALCPDTRILLAGEGFLRPAIEARIAALGLSDRILLLGFRDDPERVIAMADVCVHCADREGLPRSVLQYLAAGRPTVLFDLPGIEEIITNGVNGIVVRQGDWTEFVEAVADLLRIADTREAFAERARHTRLDAWDTAVMSRHTLEIYQDLAGQARPVPALA